MFIAEGTNRFLLFCSGWNPLQSQLCFQDWKQCHFLLKIKSCWSRASICCLPPLRPVMVSQVPLGQAVKEPRSFQIPQHCEQCIANRINHYFHNWYPIFRHLQRQLIFVFICSHSKRLSLTCKKSVFGGVFCFVLFCFELWWLPLEPVLFQQLRFLLSLSLTLGFW